MAEPLFIHSRCCNAHWELVFCEGEYSLECEKCGKPAGPSVKVFGPCLANCKCEMCEREGPKNVT